MSYNNRTGSGLSCIKRKVPNRIDKPQQVRPVLKKHNTGEEALGFGQQPQFDLGDNT